MSPFADDRGSLSLYVALFAVPFLLLAGLVIDGGAALVAKQRAADQAEQAARAGANAIDIQALRDSGLRQIDCTQAPLRVDAYRALNPGDDYVVTGCDERQITVRVTITYQSIILARPFSMPSEATASPICDTNVLCT